MELWFSELHTPNVKFSIKVDRQLYAGRSEFQRIDIFDSKEFGRFLTLDGYMMLTEKDEFIYHEMITHVPLCVNPDTRDVLVIGGGDGGTVRELVRYPGIRISTSWRSTSSSSRSAANTCRRPPAASVTSASPSTTRTG